MSAPQTKNGGVAFPAPDYVELDPASMRHGHIQSCGGMSLRQYYKAKIIAGFCANPAVFAHNNQCGWGLVNCDDGQLVGCAGKLADEMVAEDTAKQAGGAAS